MMSDAELCSESSVLTEHEARRVFFDVRSESGLTELSRDLTVDDTIVLSEFHEVSPEPSRSSPSAHCEYCEYCEYQLWALSRKAPDCAAWHACD